MKGFSEQQNMSKRNKEKIRKVEKKIKYDVITPEQRDPQPKDFDEIEY